MGNPHEQTIWDLMIHSAYRKSKYDRIDLFDNESVAEHSRIITMPSSRSFWEKQFFLLIGLDGEKRGAQRECKRNDEWFQRKICNRELLSIILMEISCIVLITIHWSFNFIPLTRLVCVLLAAFVFFHSNGTRIIRTVNGYRVIGFQLLARMRATVSLAVNVITATIYIRAFTHKHEVLLHARRLFVLY